MSQSEFPPRTPPLAAEPTEYDELPPEPSRWPAVIGTIAIVLAALGLLCFGCGTLNTIAAPFMVRMAPPGQQPPMPPTPLLVFQAATACVSTLMSAWLLAGGIGLVKRRAWARVHLMGWSVFKIVLTLLSTTISVALADLQAQHYNDSFSQGGFNVNFTFTSQFVIAIAIVMMLWYLIWPAFLLIWLARDPIRQEVATWETAREEVI